MKEPTRLEKAADNLVTKSTLSIIAAVSGTPLAALLQPLADTLAHGRHTARVEAAFKEIEIILKAHRLCLERLTDPQYKLLNEVILAVLQNTEEEKQQYLKNAVRAGLDADEITHTIAAQVSRALRDMTAGELQFLLKYSKRRILMIGPISGDIDEGACVINRNSEEMVYVSGLLGLGILIPAGSTIDDGGRYVFAVFCQMLTKLIDT